MNGKILGSAMLPNSWDLDGVATNCPEQSLKRASVGHLLPYDVPQDSSPRKSLDRSCLHMPVSGKRNIGSTLI